MTMQSKHKFECPEFLVNELSVRQFLCRRCCCFELLLLCAAAAAAALCCCFVLLLLCFELLLLLLLCLCCFVLLLWVWVWVSASGSRPRVPRGPPAFPSRAPRPPGSLPRCLEAFRKLQKPTRIMKRRMGKFRNLKKLEVLWSIYAFLK